MQGYEWDSNSSFDEILSESTELQKCIYLTYHCVEMWAERNHKVFDYIYIHIPVQETNHENWFPYESALGDLSVSKGITEVVYQNDDVSIYKVLK